MHDRKQPDFMVFLSRNQLSWFWGASGSFAATTVLVVAAPGLLVFVSG